MIDDPPAVQDAEEILDLVDGDGVAHADAHPAALVERAAAVDADQTGPWASNSGPPELPGLIEASVCRQSAYSSSVPAGNW